MSSDWENKAAVKPSVDADGTLRYSQWVRSGGMMYNRDCLGYDNPEQTYNHLKAHGITPEQYGILHPLEEIIKNEFADKSRGELVAEIFHLRKEVESMMRSGFF